MYLVHVVNDSRNTVISFRLYIDRRIIIIAVTRPLQFDRLDMIYFLIHSLVFTKKKKEKYNFSY